MKAKISLPVADPDHAHALFTFAKLFCEDEDEERDDWFWDKDLPKALKEMLNHIGASSRYGFGHRGDGYWEWGKDWEPVIERMREVANEIEKLRPSPEEEVAWDAELQKEKDDSRAD